MYTLKNGVQLIGLWATHQKLKTRKAEKNWLVLIIATNEIYRNAKGEKVKETTALTWSPGAKLPTLLKVFEQRK